MTYDAAAKWLEQRGVTLESIADIVYELQKPYNDVLRIDDCMESVKAVLRKREVQYTLMTGIALDVLAERKQLPEPLQSMLTEDESLYGVDETLALGITSMYGMIGLTSFGYLDKAKVGVLSGLNNSKSHVHVFLDDLVAGIAAAASSRIAHQNEKANVYDRYDSLLP
ncbi:phosphatidylglycerophosphatase A family protein [Paenibacillus aquistagni]|uniref:phosphatidylglycerophosphatase A family protein n=1 Tax=Paenibacillus aquistagni TaxID=1852522 RepID=UPI00145AC66C|nr:phosphatidylglycerophosphatase A [Paenibacillus aquistagni]NMM53736.1 phosphatidylglycerophosphatase A [Paenibacillus aquistagni]